MVSIQFRVKELINAMTMGVCKHYNEIRITKLRDFLHSLATDHMVPTVGSLCL